MPYSREAEYYHFKRYDPDEFVPGGMTPKKKKKGQKKPEPRDFVTVPISHTDYRGKKFNKPGVKARIGVHKKDARKEGPEGGRVERIQTILKPKPKKVLEKQRKRKQQKPKGKKGGKK